MRHFIALTKNGKTLTIHFTIEYERLRNKIMKKQVCLLE